MNSTIHQFVVEQTAASFCCVDAEGRPYCWTCFYAFDAENGRLFFKTGAESHHTPLMLQNPKLAGTILPDHLNTKAIQGVQWEGELLPQTHELTQNAEAQYYLRYSFAKNTPGVIYAVQVNHLKMTDNTQGFGTKLHWYRDEQFNQA